MEMETTVSRIFHIALLISTYFLLFLNMNLFSQDAENNRSLYLEVGKNGLIFNVVLDNELKEGSYGYRAHIGTNFDPELTAYKAGAGLYKVLGSPTQQLELGMDVEYLIIEEGDNDAVVTGFLVYPQKSVQGILLSTNVGYRSTRQERGVFRVGISPMYLKTNLFLGGYLSYGLRF